MSATGRLDRLLRPRSLVFVGGRVAGLAVDASRSLGFSGDMWAVNPRRSLCGLATFAAVDDLPAAADAAFVGVDCRASVDVVGELAAAGVGAAVCHASGFAETGEAGAALQADLLRAAAGMPVVGPNCYGTLSATTGAALWPDVHGLARCPRGVAFLSQSGNVAVNLSMQRRGIDVVHVMALGNQADVGVAEALEAMVADEAVTGLGLVLEAVDDVGRFAAAAHAARGRGLPVVALKLGASAASSSIAVTHTASLVGDNAAYDALFSRLGIRRVHTVPELLDTLAVVCATGPLSGNRLVSLSCSGGEAALIADRGQGLDLEFPEFAPDHAEQVTSVMDGRVAVTNPLDYQTFIWGDEARLAGCFSAVLAPGADDIGAAPPFDAALLVLDFPARGLDWSRWWPTLRAFGESCTAGATPGVVAASMAENLPEEVRVRAAELGVATCGDIDTALAALEAAAALGRPPNDESSPADGLLPPAIGGPPATCEPSGSSLAASSSPSSSSPSLARSSSPSSSSPSLARSSSPSSSSPSSSSPSLARSSSPSLSSPSSSSPSSSSSSSSPSSSSPSLARSSSSAGSGGAAGASPCRHPERPYGRGVTADAGPGRSLVLLEHEAKRRLAAAGIAVPAGRAVAADRASDAAECIGYPVVVKATGTAHKTESGGVVVGLYDSAAVATTARRLAAGTDGTVIVESCVTGVVAELLVSVRSVPPVGMLLTLGAGGTLAELLDDSVSLLLPASAEEVIRALRSLRIWPLLAGHRGGPPAAVDTLLDAVSALGTLVRDDRSITEVEINPMLVTHQSAIAADALMLVTATAVSGAATTAEPVAATAVSGAATTAEPVAATAVSGAATTAEPVAATAVSGAATTAEPVAATAVSGAATTAEPVAATAVSGAATTAEPVAATTAEPVAATAVSGAAPWERR